ncbi:hypothetical protein ACFLZP_00830 [Patescibacteria group bacterium]
MVERARVLERSENYSLRIGIDLDETTFSIFNPVVEYLKSWYLTTFTEADIINYLWLIEFLKQLGCSQEVTNEEVDLIFGPDDRLRVYQDAPSLPNAVLVLNQLHDAGHELFVLTSRPFGTLGVTNSLLSACGLGWLAGDVAEGGRILMMDQGYQNKFSGDGDAFKLSVIKGDLEDGKYVGFSGLDFHLDDRASLWSHPLARGIQERLIFLTLGYRQRLIPDNVSIDDQMVANWLSFGEYISGRKLFLNCVAQS